jgi:hypothetical protein
MAEMLRDKHLLVGIARASKDPDRVSNASQANSKDLEETTTT